MTNLWPYPNWTKAESYTTTPVCLVPSFHFLIPLDVVVVVYVLLLSTLQLIDNDNISASVCPFLPASINLFIVENPSYLSLSLVCLFTKEERQIVDKRKDLDRERERERETQYITCIGLVREAGRFFKRRICLDFLFFFEFFFFIFSRFLFDWRVQKKNTESLSASSQVGSQREPSTFHINATNLFIEFSLPPPTVVLHISLIFHQSFLRLKSIRHDHSDTNIPNGVYQLVLPKLQPTN